jgi:predicted metal-dependent phosphoesterase TrpH
MRVDLHVHTVHSRLRVIPVLGARDSYSDPLAVYRQARARGMDLVTFTDHDTIDGCLALLSRTGPLEDFFISEEVSVRDPRTGSRFHVSVFGIDERQHEEIQRRRGDLRDLASYLRAQGIPASLNHVGSSLVKVRPPLEELAQIASGFPLIETLNGAQIVAANAVAEQLARLLEEDGRMIGRVGGSDAHTTRRIGWTWTSAAAVNRDGFLAALGEGAVRPEGLSAAVCPMLRDVYQVVAAYYGDLLWNSAGHFGPRSRRRAAACAMLSLPLHLMALPATGTIYRRLRVRGASRGLQKELERRVEELDAAGRARTEEAAGASAEAV